MCVCVFTSVPGTMESIYDVREKFGDGQKHDVEYPIPPTVWSAESNYRTKYLVGQG